MNPAVRNIFIACAIVLALGVAGAAFAGVPATILAPMITGSATVLGSVGAVIYAKGQEQRREIEQRQHDKKAEVYREFFDYWFGEMRRTPGLPESKRKQANDRYYSTMPQKLVTWASESVIKEYGDYMGFDQQESKDIFEFEKLLLSIRADLGHSNDGLAKGDLLRMFLTGVDTRLQKERNR